MRTCEFEPESRLDVDVDAAAENGRFWWGHVHHPYSVDKRSTSAACTCERTFTRRYVAVTSIFAVIVGALDVAFLKLLGIPHPLLWAWVIGPLGAVLAVPLSLLVKASFINEVPSGRWLAGFVEAAPRRSRRTPAARPESGSQSPDKGAKD